jgi:hypothetical protein
VKKLLSRTKHYRKKTMFNESAEKLNGRAAMVGFIAAVGSYLATGQVIPGVW